MDAHGFPDQLHEIQQFERDLGLELDQFAVTAMKD